MSEKPEPGEIVEKFFIPIKRVKCPVFVNTMTLPSKNLEAPVQNGGLNAKKRRIEAAFEVTKH